MVEKAFPKYADIGEARVVDLSADGLPFIPVLGEAHYTKTRPGGDDRHVHPGMVEILLCRRGRGLSIDCGDRVHPFPPGTVMALQPEVPHVITPKPKSLLTNWIWFKLPPHGRSLPGMTLPQTRWLVARLMQLPVTFPATGECVQSFRRLWRIFDETPRKAPERRLVVREALMRLLMDVFDSADTMRQPTSDDSRLKALVTEIRERPSREWSLEELSSRSAMSVPLLVERFRRLTGLPPHQFVVACRVEKAKELLSGTDRSVGAIANDLGIATAQHFATVFRRETGMSPGRWRASCRARE